MVGDKDHVLAQIDSRFGKLLDLSLMSLKDTETEIFAVRKLALGFLGEAIARFSPTYLAWLEAAVSLCRMMVFESPIDKKDIWLHIPGRAPDWNPIKVAYRLILWPDIAVFVPRTRKTFAFHEAPQVEVCANRILDDDESTRNIGKRFLRMGSSAGPERWRDCAPPVRLVGEPIPTLKVCALVAADAGISQESKNLAAWYLQKAPAIESWGKRVIGETYQKRPPLLRDIHAVLREIG